VAYYMHKFKEFVAAMNVVSVGGEVSALDDCPPIVQKIFKKICSSRWVSTERQTFELVRLLNAPASDSLVAAVAGDFEDQEEWEECKELLSCIDQREQLSHLTLVFMHLSNHTPGGRGEGRTNLAELVAFLCSPWNRIAIVFTAALYPQHMEWARFADGVSGTHTRIRPELFLRA
jgi:hypothetical protein